jgi:flagellar biosynthesis protein FlhG
LEKESLLLVDDQALINTTDNEPVIIPIAGGKGGVGKSFLSANLAIALAQKGHKTIAVDLDLGGSSLFNFVGLANRFPGIGDYLRAKREDLSELLIPTEIPNLRYLPGDGRSPFMANISYAQKKKLLRHLKMLDANYLILDLGSGSSYNTLDFFSLGQTGIMMTTPDHPAVLKMLTFLKNLLLRKIEELIGANLFMKSILNEMYDQPIESQMQSISQLVERLEEEDCDLATAVMEIQSSFRPRIVFNMGTHPDDAILTKQIDSSLSSVLGIAADYFGFIFADPTVRETIQTRRPYLLAQPESVTSQEIQKIAERISKYWSTPISGSSNLILARAHKIYLERGLPDKRAPILNDNVS